MPAIYWLPLPNMRRAARVEHLHAAFSRWFDQPDADSGDDHAPSVSPPTRHHDNVKPYRIAPMSQRDGQWGAELSVLSESAFCALEGKVRQSTSVRLGGVGTPVGVPLVVQGQSWDDLLHWRGETGWRVDFLTPYTSRTGSRSSPYPSPPAMLRAAVDAWGQAATWGAVAEPEIPAPITSANYRDLWVSQIDLDTTTYSINGHRHPGALGSMTVLATAAAAPLVSPLFRLAHYCGMGSFRGKGMGVVTVNPVLPGRR